LKGLKVGWFEIFFPNKKIRLAAAAARRISLNLMEQKELRVLTALALPSSISLHK
jgi:hypothetical protein